MSLSLFFCAPLFLLPALAKWQKEAVGGLASCISHMHYSCALQSVWVLVFCWLFTGTHGPRERALCAGHRAWWKSCTDGTTNSLISALSLLDESTREWVYFTDQHSSAKWGGFLRQDQECLFSVSPNSTDRLFTTKCSPSLFLPADQRPAKISVKSALMLIWETCPRLLLARISGCLAARLPLHHIRIQRLSSLLLECAQ